MSPIFKSIGLTLTVAQLAASLPLLGANAPAAVTAAPANTKASGPHIEFSETVFGFGKVKPTDTLKHEFIVTNTGNALLEITAVQPGCGCTTAGAWDKEVAPGKTGKIPIQFNPANFSGPVTKYVTVTCNDPTRASHTLQVQATIWRPIDLQPQYVHFLSVEGEATNETKTIRIVNNEEEPVTLEAPQSSSPVFKTELKTVRPGKEFELQVSYTGPVSNASMQGIISIKTSATNMPALSASAFAMPQPAVAVTPQYIQLPAGPFSPEYKYTAIVRNNSSTPLKLSDASVNAEGVKVQVQDMEPGKSFQLNLSFTADFKPQSGQPMELTVKTSHPKYPILKVSINQAGSPVAVPPATAARVTGAK
jgi:hypothetical protein